MYSVDEDPQVIPGATLNTCILALKQTHHPPGPERELYRLNCCPTCKPGGPACLVPILPSDFTACCLYCQVTILPA